MMYIMASEQDEHRHEPDFFGQAIPAISVCLHASVTGAGKLPKLG
jgi:hypothetical protein